MIRLYLLLIFFLPVARGYSQNPERDTVLSIRAQEELFQLNPVSYLLKDPEGKLDLAGVLARDSSFTLLHQEMYDFYQDDHIDVYWLRCRVSNFTTSSLRYLLYFHPGLDTLDSFIFNPDGTQVQMSISSFEPTQNRPVFISQELVLPVVLQEGTTSMYFRVTNRSVYSKQLNSIIVAMADASSFLNYFLQVRQYQGIALGMLCVMLVFHIFIYLFFRDTTYLIFVINVFVTLIYLLLRKHYLEEVPMLEPIFPVLRYFHDPFSILLSLTVLLFSQSFLNTQKEDPVIHRLMNYLALVLLAVSASMITLQFLHFMNLMSIYLGFLTSVIVLISALRSFRRGNTLALYVFFGFLLFLFVPLIYLIPLPGYLHFRNNESDLHYFSEAIRSLIFAVGIADRFYGIKKEGVRKELERQQLAFEKELQVQAEKDRIRRDLHDSLGGQLSSISIGLNRLISIEKNESLTAIQNLADKAVKELRDSLWVLDKTEISIDELEERVNSLFWHYRKIDLPVEMELQLKGGKNQKLSSVTAGHLFRIVQEATQNAIKHSEAQKIQVVLQIDSGVLFLTISDNGKGFVWPAKEEYDHFGLRNMQKRAEQIHAEFSIKSNLGQGTTVSIRLNEKGLNGHPL